ncbi:lipocalin-like domain-containing protein [Streptomyces sp. NPDC001714]|uniref:lipocalin-like domain-containing protein n=1 Tax=Streptomyces sp. NPDC001714 TaxID=3364603 RepID=UPI00369031C1
MTLAGTVAVTCALAIPQVSSAAPAHHGASPAPHSAAATTATTPTFVHLPADQAAHPGTEIEWWYTVGHLYARGHEYGYEVQLTSSGMAQLAITDVTSNKYYTQTLQYKDGEYSVSSKKLDVRLPDATLSGPMNDMHLTATLPEGHLDLRLAAKGPAMYNNGTGLFPFLKGSSYYYSLPNLQTSGTLTLGGKTTKVTGQSWLDRQWGNWDFTQLNKWTWMPLQLKNGEYLNLWDLYDKQGEERWATVLHKDGSESIVSVKPVAKHATNFETSPTSGKRYAGRWTVEIPSLKATLTVTATPTLQEIQGPGGGPNEATATVKGTYQGKPVTGRAYVEQFGNWK